jgi:hypothetical protein
MQRMKPSENTNDKLPQRLITSTAVAATVDSIIFLPIIFYSPVHNGIMSASSVLLIGFMLLIAKVSIEVIFVITGITQRIIRTVKIIEGIDVCDDTSKYTVKNMIKTRGSIFFNNPPKRSDSTENVLRIYKNKHRLTYFILKTFTSSTFKYVIAICLSVLMACTLTYDIFFFFLYW